MILDKLKAYGWMAAAIAAGALLATQTVRLHTEQRAHLLLITATAQAEAGRATAALQYEQLTATKEHAHAATTQKVSDDFTTSQPVRDAIARVDLTRLDRLRTDAERRAASYRAQAAAGAAACGSLADQHAALDAHIVRGGGVVAGLRSDLVRRDAEVVLLRGVVDADRALIENGLD